MEWIKILNRKEKIPSFPFIYTDGNRVVCADSDNDAIAAQAYLPLEDATHWMPITLPKEENVQEF